MIGCVRVLLYKEHCENYFVSVEPVVFAAEWRPSRCAPSSSASTAGGTRTSSWPS